MGVSFASVNRWENEQARPSTLAWQKIALAEERGVEALDAGRMAVAEPQPSYRAEAAGPFQVDFSADPEIVRVVAEGERLTYGYLFNPAFATELSLIEPLPHQRIAVYERMLPQTRLRFLLADDAGAGKTIMAGLYIREMLSRRLVSRVLVVPPAGLIGNWRRELLTLFGLPFRIVSGSEARLANPFTGPESDLLIVSVDTLAGDRMFSRLQDAATAPYDLVIFDEAHKLAADREPDFGLRKTDRYRLGESLAGIATRDPRWELNWHSRHFLLLTATPHMGKEFPYYCLWRLLEPEALSTIDAFNDYPLDARSRHFIRRTKEEMVRFDGSPIYPTRLSDTISYDLRQGDVSEQSLYEQTTRYIQTYYNRARILNRSAARLAMSVFQRRLASSTYALMRSFERRLNKLSDLINDIQSGALSLDQLRVRQQKLDAPDTLDQKTADEEEPQDGREENEIAEERALEAVVAVSLAELETERSEVRSLLELARRVYEAREESKFLKLSEVLRDPKFRDEKLIIFTEYKDTLDFLVRRLEGLGFTGKLARIHGGMDYRDREEQVELFRLPGDQGGATYLVATDAAGEGINLQFSWLMVNFDIPWNPARLEQRMGRIHRYGQTHNPVVIVNIVAGKTREGRVMQTLLLKLERIRKELGSDKVFDVIGRLFEGISIREYMEAALTEEGANQVEQKIEGKLTKEQVDALAERERILFGDGGDIRRELPRLTASIEQEPYLRLLPGYVRRFVEKSAPLVGVGLDGDLDGLFAFKALKAGALDPIWTVLESYQPDQRDALTFYKPKAKDLAIFLHPGEPVFEKFRAYVCGFFARDGLRGAVFVDPSAHRPYLFHLVRIAVVRKADPALRPLNREELVDYRIVGLKQNDAGEVEECPVEYLLLLRGIRGIPPSAIRLVANVEASITLATHFALESVAQPLADQRRLRLLESLAERQEFVRRGFDYEEGELAAARARLTDQVQAGDSRAKAELTRIKERQRALQGRRQEALAVLIREPELISPGETEIVAHALVVPSGAPEDLRRYDAAIEAVAVKVAKAHEETNGSIVRDVSTPELALAAGLTEHPGFDLLSRRPDGLELAIEVKGRAAVGDVQLSENEYVKACNLGDRYWLYVVFECASPHPQLKRVQDPFHKLLFHQVGGVLVDEREIFRAAEQ